MKYFILSQDKKVIAIKDYLKRPDIDPDFARFVRREALGEVLVAQSNARPAYLKYARKFGFAWEPNADIGHVQYNYKANLMRRLVQDYARQLVHELGMPVYEVNGANMFSMAHPVVDAYAALFGDRLYQFKSGDHKVVMSYDASYPQFNLAGRAPLKRKQLPFAHFSLADCYRHEQSGEMMLLLRQRRFFMPDLHPYFHDVAEAFAWFPKFQAKIVEAARQAGREYQVVVEVPSQQNWEDYRAHIEQIPVDLGADVLVNIIEDGQDRYWVVNVDYKIIDQIGQVREIGCVQIDIGNAPRLNIRYLDEHGRVKHPAIIHSAIPGGIERYLYLALDNFESAGGLPLWLAPVQLRLLPVGKAFIQPCQKLLKKLQKYPLRIEIDDRNLSVAAKLRAAHEDLVPHSMVVGQKELAGGARALENQIKQFVVQVKGKPFLRREWPAELSKSL
jgi:threonyl-tRNA synthetase